VTIKIMYRMGANEVGGRERCADVRHEGFNVSEVT
jgi:hypothetical protein